MSELFLKLVELSLMGSVLILAVLLLRLVLRQLKAPAWLTCALWALVALRLVCPFTLESDLSLMPRPLTTGLVVDQMTDGYVGDILINWPETEEFDTAVQGGIQVEDEGYVITAPDGVSPAPTVRTAWVPTLAAVWLLGVAALLLYSFLSWRQLKRQVAAALEVDGVMVCDHLQSPFILGVFRPRIYLPSDLSGQAREAVLAHERAHLARHDHWWKPLAFLVLTLHWFNPLVWLAYVLLCRDMELACDEKVVRSYTPAQRKVYSAALLDLSLPRRRVAACPLAFGEVGVKERIVRVLNYKKPAFWVVVMALVLAAAAAVCLLTAPPRERSLCIDGWTYLQTDTHAQLPEGSRQIGRLEDITDGSFVRDWTGVNLKESYQGAPIFQADPRCLTVYLVTSDGNIAFEAAPLPTVEGKPSAPYEWPSGTGRLTLPEYPDLVLECSPTQVSSVSQNGHTVRIGGKSLNSVWLLDLNGDGRREICAEVDWWDESQNSGTCIQVCDLNDPEGFYQLYDPLIYDYHLMFREGRLAVNQTGYQDSITLAQGSLVLEDGQLGMANDLPGSILPPDEATRRDWYAQYEVIVREVAQATGQDISLLPYEELKEADFLPPAVFRRMVETIASHELVWVGQKPQLVLTPDRQGR